MSITCIQGGSFTSTGNGQYVPVECDPDYFIATNLTQAAAATNTVGFEFQWWKDKTPVAGALQKLFQSTGAVTLSALTSGGFVFNDPYPPQYPIQSGTVITAAGPAVATATNTLNNGDRIRLTSMTAMLQISTMLVTVSSVSSGGFTMAGLNTTGFSAETAFKFQKVGPFEPVLPEYAIITNISNAINGVITVSTITNYQPGMKIRLNNTKSYGMAAIEGAEATILSVGAFTTYGTYTLTTDLNTTGAGTWTWPTSGPSVNSPRFATIAPDGQKAYYDIYANIQYGYNVTQAPFHSAYPSPTMFLYGGANGPGGQLNDFIEWQCFRYE